MQILHVDMSLHVSIFFKIQMHVHTHTGKSGDQYSSDIQDDKIAKTTVTVGSLAWLWTPMFSCGPAGVLSFDMAGADTVPLPQPL